MGEELPGVIHRKEEEEDQKELVKNADSQDGTPHNGMGPGEGPVPQQHGAHDHKDNHGCRQAPNCKGTDSWNN